MKQEAPTSISRSSSHELQIAISIYLSALYDFADLLNNSNDYHELLDEINNMNSNVDHLVKLYQKALEEEEEAQKGDPNE